jgi:two-component system OmpR family response regulator
METRKRILVVEDEEAIARGLRFNFEQEGYLAIVCRDGPTALTHFASGAPAIDLVVLDLMLPGMSGYEICREIRVKSRHVPILVLSARTLSEDRAHAFDVGVDQYMTKPFALPELLSRCRNLLDRNERLGLGAAAPVVPAVPAGPYRFRNVEVDPRTFEVRAGETVYQLTTMEMQLLRYFLDHPGEVLPRAQILRDVWDQSAEITTRSIDNFVMRLRKYIELDAANPRHLLSVRGTGYRFIPDLGDTNGHGSVPPSSDRDEPAGA